MAVSRKSAAQGIILDSAVKAASFQPVDNVDDVDGVDFVDAEKGHLQGCVHFVHNVQPVH